MANDLIEPDNIPIFDITSINLVELGRRLKETMQTHRPSSIFFKSRHNEKALLDIEYQRAIIAQIEDLRDMNSALLNLNADVYLTQERLARIIQRYREQENFIDAEGYRLSERAEVEHIDYMQSIQDNAAIRDKNIESLNLDNIRKQQEIDLLNSQAKLLSEKHERELRALELENDRRKGEIALLKAQEENIIGQGLQDGLKREFMKKVIDTIDLKELPDYLRTFVINAIFNPTQKIDNSLTMMDDLKQFVLRKEEAIARKEEAEAIEKESQADISRATSDKSVHELKRSIK